MRIPTKVLISIFLVLVAGPRSGWGISEECFQLQARVCAAKDPKKGPSLVEIAKFWRDKRENVASRIRSGSHRNEMEKSLGRFLNACGNIENYAKQETALVGARLRKISELKTKEAALAQWAVLFRAGEPTVLAWGLAEEASGEPQLVVNLGIPLLPKAVDYKREEIREDYENIIRTFFKAIGTSSPDKSAINVLAFEMALVQVPKVSEKAMKTNLKELRKKWPLLGLESYWNELAQEARVLVPNPAALEAVHGFLMTAKTEMIKDLLIYYSLANDLNEAFDDFVDERNEFWSAQFGVKKRTPSPALCLSNLKETFQSELSYLAFDEEKSKLASRDVLTNAWKSWPGELAALLKSLDWILPDHREKLAAWTKEMKITWTSLDSPLAWGVGTLPGFADRDPVQNKRLLHQYQRAQAVLQMKSWLEKGMNPRAFDILQPSWDAKARTFFVPPTILIFADRRMGGFEVLLRQQMASVVFSEWLRNSDKEEKEGLRSRLAVPLKNFESAGVDPAGLSVVLPSLQWAIAGADRMASQRTLQAFRDFVVLWCGYESDKTKGEVQTLSQWFIRPVFLQQFFLFQKDFRKAAGCAASPDTPVADLEVSIFGDQSRKK